MSPTISQIYGKIKRPTLIIVLLYSSQDVDIAIPLTLDHLISCILHVVSTATKHDISNKVRYIYHRYITDIYILGLRFGAVLQWTVLGLRVEV